MPYDKTPSISTYQTKQLSLVGEMNSRAQTPTKDVDYLNCFPEQLKNKTTQQQQISLRKRSGVSTIATLGSGTIRGVYFWEDQAKAYVVLGDDIAIYSMPAGTLSTTLNSVFGTSSGEVGFTEFLYEDGTVKLVVTDGTTLSTIDTANTVVAGADADMPVHIPQIVFLDGYLFLVKVNTADLYNSNLNDPLAYTAGDFISSEMIPDRATWLSKLNNYLLLWGNESIEYFWDAANESGSPLQRNDTPIKLVGLIGGIAHHGNKIYFVGDVNHSEPSLFMLEDFKITPIGNEQMRRFLTGAVASSIYANVVSTDGHDFYVLHNGSYTFALELETLLWTRWGFAQTDSFDLQYAFNMKNSTAYTPVFTRASTQKLYKFSPSIYQDDSSTMTVKWISDNEEFDTYKQKSMSGLTIWADKPTSSSSVLVQWSDDDYQTYTTGISVDLYQEIPDLKRLGRFRRRAFKFTHESNHPLRIHGIEVDINMGVH